MTWLDQCAELAPDVFTAAANIGVVVAGLSGSATSVVLAASQVGDMVKAGVRFYQERAVARLERPRSSRSAISRSTMPVLAMKMS